jgi:uncharacterized membrane protein
VILAIGDFIQKYYIDPIVYNQGYNVVNTLTYAVILGISIIVILKLLGMLKVKIDERLVVATAPFILMGASLRVLEDVKILSQPYSYLLVTPFVYIVAFLITAALLFGFILLERKGIIRDYSKPFFASGIVLSLAVLATLLTRHLVTWWAPILIIVLAAAVTGAVYLIARYLKLGFLTIPLNVAILFAHMFDASATFTAISIVGGFAEKHVVPGLFIGFTNSAAVMYVLKLAVFIPVIYLIEKYFADDKEMYYALKFALLVLGFGPGIRDTLELLVL